MASPRATRNTREAAAGPARLLAAVGLIALLGGIGVIVVESGGKDGGQPPVAAVATPPASAPVSKPPPAVRIPVTGVGAYDPEGDRSENDGDARLATDGSRATAWKSERYRSSFTKSGVGLVLDAGRPVKISRVTVVTESPGARAQVRVGASAQGPFVTVSGAKTMTPRTIFALRPRSGRYLMLWITSMPTSRTAAVNEITATAAG